MKKSLIVTEKQMQVIRDACELYGRIQIGQFREFAEIVTQTGFSGVGIRVEPDRKEGETKEEHKARCEERYDYDSAVYGCLLGAVNGIVREAYSYEMKPRTNEADIALDIWAVLDGRRDAGFHMGTEPLVEVEERE